MQERLADMWDEIVNKGVLIEEKGAKLWEREYIQRKNFYM